MKDPLFSDDVIYIAFYVSCSIAVLILTVWFIILDSKRQKFPKIHK